MEFSVLGAHPLLLRAIEARGYTEPTAVQAAVLDSEFTERDLLVSSQTGSGKTIAFGLALASTLLGESEKFAAVSDPVALVVAPTRELAQQVSRELSWLYASTGARIATCVGGMDPRVEARTLGHGVHFVVGTPGRLCDHLDRKNLDVSHLRALVLDEADEMLDMGFRDELERILRDAPEKRRTLLFSATIPQGIEELASRYQRNAARIAATPTTQAHQDIEYRAHLISYREREHAVVNTLRLLEESQALVFCETRNGVTHLHANLVERGFAAVAISGELSQPERNRALTTLRDGRARVLVATDVAARGLDLPDIGLVIHADLPHDYDMLQHRSGRTGRAGRKGVAVLLVPTREKMLAERMLNRAHVKGVWTPAPTAEVVRALDQERLLKELRAESEENSDEDISVATELLAGSSPESLVATLVRMRRATRPAPEELPETIALLARPNRPVRERPATRGDARSEYTAGRSRPHSATEQAGMVWFKLNVGRNQKADPRWLLPLICRRGQVSHASIGTIQILANETRFAVVADAAERFAVASQRPDTKEPWVRFRPAERAVPEPAKDTKTPWGRLHSAARAAPEPGKDGKAPWVRFRSAGRVASAEPAKDTKPAPPPKSSRRPSRKSK